MKRIIIIFFFIKQMKALMMFELQKKNCSKLFWNYFSEEAFYIHFISFQKLEIWFEIRKNFITVHFFKKSIQRNDHFFLSVYSCRKSTFNNLEMRKYRIFRSLKFWDYILQTMTNFDHWNIFHMWAYAQLLEFSRIRALPMKEMTVLSFPIPYFTRKESPSSIHPQKRYFEEEI